MADIESLKQALALSPDNVPLLIMLGRAYLEEFSLEEAGEQFNRAASLEPSNPEARVAVIEVLNLSGKTSEAILRAEALTTEQPDHAPTWMLLARMHLEEEDGDEARKAYDQAVRIDPKLRDDSLLRQIKAAGGSEPTPPENPDPESVATSNDWQAGAMMDPNHDPEKEAEARNEEMKLTFMQRADDDFDSVGGMESVKEQIRMKILYPLQNKELFEAYGKKAGGGVLLYGPPGCGKTLISRATAGEIDANFFSIGLHQVLEMWMGRSEQKLHEIFELARANKPAVLFFDEIDAMAADRRDMRGSAARTLVNQFLAEMDGNIDSNEDVLVLGATNAPWHLDSAFLRPGRFDRLIFVPPPDEPAREQIIEVMAKGKPMAEFNVGDVAKKTKDFSGADIKAVFDVAVEASLTEAMKKGKVVPVGTKDLIKARKQVKPSTLKWFESAKNYALYANQSGFYDDVLEHLGIRK